MELVNWETKRNSSHCVDVNECKLNNGGCSQDCINSRGSYHCTCSDQYYLESDLKTCVQRPPRCPKLSPPDNGEMDCTQNVAVNFLYAELDDSEAVPAETGRGDLGASGWAASRVALSTSGRHGKRKPFFNSGSTCNIRCQKGYKLVGDSSISCDRTGHWIGEPATCIRNWIHFNCPNFEKKILILVLISALACPKLQAPDNGVLMPHTCGTGKTFGGQQCSVRCKTGYRLIGGATPYLCLATSQTWRSPDEPPRCERVDSPVPFIQCPGNMAVNLPPQEKLAYVTFSQPKSNMDWFRYSLIKFNTNFGYYNWIEWTGTWILNQFGPSNWVVNSAWVLIRSNSAWGRPFRTSQPLAHSQSKSLVNYFKLELIGIGKIENWYFVDKEAPRVTNCPTSFTVYLEPGQSSQIVTWNEPIFTDNIQVVQLNKSKVGSIKFNSQLDDD